MPKKVYAVRAGRACGIFTTWAECKKQVDGFAGARYKGFTDVSEALAWLNGGERTLPQAAPAPQAAPKAPWHGASQGAGGKTPAKNISKPATNDLA